MLTKREFDIQGITCQACVNRLEKVLQKNPYIKQASVNLITEDAQIEYDSKQLSNSKIIELINKAGFTGSVKTSPLQIKKEPFPWRLLCLWIICTPFVIGMVGMMSGHPNWMLSLKVQFFLATIVQFFLATPFYKSAYASIKTGSANMDVLVVLGSIIIWLYSSINLWLNFENAHHQIYFEASVMVISFVSLGKYIENKVKHNSLNSLNLLLELTPKQVQIYRNQQWQTLDYNKIKHGDLIRAIQGDRIAADGSIIEGKAWVEQSHLTGESIPLIKQIKDKVLAGSLVSDGSIIYQVEKIETETLLADMMQALNQAQSSKAPIARIADKVTSIFVPSVIVISIITAIITYLVTYDIVKSINHAVAVLVIACPCALGLATPASIMIAIGLASRHGIWFKNADILENTAKIDTVVFDKTGTLTEGQPKVIDWYLKENSNFNKNQLLQIAGSLEQNSKHPLALAIIDYVEDQQITLLPCKNIKNQLGQGISAEIDNFGLVKVGTDEFCKQDFNLPNSDIWQNSSLVIVSVNDQPIGGFALQDSLRKDSFKTIKKLKDQGINTYIISGDKQEVVNNISKELNLPSNHAFGNILPREKANIIQELINKGHQVAMVGDGINDAPALATANVGFAMLHGSAITAETASVKLMHNSISQIYTAIYLSKATVHNIKQNLFFAFIYNILGIPLAAFGFLSPIIAGSAMALSSISVLINALRLKYIKLNN